MKWVLAILALASAAEAKPLTRPPPIAVRMHDVVVEGSLARARVYRLLQAQRGKLQTCFEWIDPKTTKERLAVTFEIVASGRVNKLSTRGIDGAATCTRHTLENVTYDRPPDGKPVRVRLALSVELG